MIRFAAGCVLLLPAVAVAQDAQRPAAYQALIDCRAIGSADLRLACFDRTAAALAQAETARDVIVVDRTEVERRERERFGSQRRSDSVLKDPSGQEVERLETSVSGISYAPTGQLVLRFAEGGVWQQTDNDRLRRDPKIGSSATIKSAALGTYLVNIDGQRAIRMRRTD